ncbi:MAG TPA: cation:proton antiporter [Flavobacteriales bacterium]
MPKVRSLLFYVLVVGTCLAAMWTIIAHGPSAGLPDAGTHGLWQQFKDTYHENLTHPLAILLLQIITIIITARALGFICSRIGLPVVIGEIAAGILLGPSFLASQFPAYSGFLFPVASMPNLQFLSQIGLILFMFVIGMELDLQVMKDRLKDALVVSHVGIVIPFTFGVALAYAMHERFMPAHTGFLGFALFLGISMSIAAFPVLARIVQERGWQRTSFGSTVITFAAADDVTAWCLLAIVIAVVKAGTFASSIWTVLMTAAFLFLMFRVVRPFLQRLGDAYADRDSLSKPIVAVYIVLLLLSAYTTEVIGIHALYGAFVAGVIMPNNLRFRTLFIDKIEDLAVVLLLPLFFVFTGLRTEIGLLNDVGLWKWCAVIVAVATIGKFSGSAIAARFVGLSMRESLMTGALMNTRGLMELVVLNIGYDLGVIGPEIFAMMVIMALVTTLMTGPALTLIERLMPLPRKNDAQARAREARTFRVLVPFGDPLRGRNMVRLANALVNRNTNARITALHLVPSGDLNQYNQEERERESFRPIRKDARNHEIRLDTLFQASSDLPRDVAATANNGTYDMAIIGVGRGIYQGTLLGRIVGITSRFIDPERLLGSITGKEKLFGEEVFDDRVRQLLREIRIPLGIYVEKDPQPPDHVVIPFFSLTDSFLMTYVQKLLVNHGSHITLIDMVGVFDQSPELLQTVQAMETTAPGKLVLMRSIATDDRLPELEGADLMLIGIEAWTKAVEEGRSWLQTSPSVLIMRP